MKRQKTKKIGFTLIELLVVIAIIGILAGLLFPAISGGIQKATAMRIGNNGRSIAQLFTAENIQLQQFNKSEVWPTPGMKVNSVTITEGEGAANDFFDAVVTGEIVDGLSGYSLFAGAGIPECPIDKSSDFQNGGYNLWNVVALSSSAGDPPFLFSRNMDDVDSIKTELSATSADNDKKWNAFINKSPDKYGKPFGNAYVIVISRNGTSQVVPGKYMYRSTFVGAGESAVTNSADTMELWQANGGIGNSTGD